jgi:hypothetical protein
MEMIIHYYEDNIILRFIRNLKKNICQMRNNNYTDKRFFIGKRV